MYSLIQKESVNSLELDCQEKQLMYPFSSLGPGAYFTFRSTPRGSFQIWVEIESFELETIILSVIILRNRLLDGSLSLSSQGFHSRRKSFFIKVSQKKNS